MTIDPRGTIIDMNLEGGFARSPRPASGMRIGGLFGLAAIGAFALAGLVLAAWLAITLLPVMLGVMLAAVLLTRVRAWRRGSRIVRF